MRLSYDPIYESAPIGITLTVLVIALLFWITPTGITPVRRWTLLALRGAAATALVLTMLRPSLVRTDNRPSVATLAVAIDASRSMTLASGDVGIGDAGVNAEGAEDRWQQENRVLDEMASQLASLDDNLNVALYRYDFLSERIGSGSAGEMEDTLTILRENPPTGVLTDLAMPLEMILASSRGNPLAGIVLLSDGTQTLTGAATEDSGPGLGPSAKQTDASEKRSSLDPESSAKQIAAIGVPLWTVALGPAAEVSGVRDVAIESLPETYHLFTGNESEITFEVRTQGYAGHPIELTLTWVHEDGERQITATRTITPSDNLQSHAIEIPVIAPEPGRYRLIAAARSPAGETDASNDSQVAFVDVRAGGGRVLYLEGTPRLEQFYLRRALGRFPDLELSYRWIPRDTSPRWPASLEDELQSGRYDIIIIGDLHSAALGDKQLQQLADLVADGTALITLGGERAYGPGGYADSPLAQVLPVEINGGLAQPPGAEMDEKPPGQLPGPIALHPTRRHPITDIEIGAAGQSGQQVITWETLPPMPGANLLVGVKTRPGVLVLLADENDEMMLGIGEYGQGRVASLAFDSTWVWWSGGASEFHRRFWRQLMLWLLSREESDEGQLELQMTRRRFMTSQNSEFTASIRLDEKTNTPPMWSAEIRLESGDTVTLPSSAKTRPEGDMRLARLSGNVAGENPLPPGIHSLRVRLGGQADPIASAELPFQVIDDTRELRASGADHAMLDRLARITQAAGGEAFRADQVDDLVERISTQRRRAEQVVIEKWRLGDSPLSGWLIFILFAGCLSVEWTLRRRWGLA